MSFQLWTPTQDEQVLALWQGGCSAGEIEARLHGEKSRNAILGRLHRLRQTMPEIDDGRVKRPRTTKPRAPTVKTVPVPHPPRQTQTLRRILEPVEPPVVIVRVHEVAPNGEPAPLLALCSAACKWPVNSGGPYLFCNKVRRGDGSYCDEHTLQSYAVKVEEAAK